MKRLNPLRLNRLGQGMVEYSLILSLVSVVMIGSLTILQQSLQNTFDSISNALSFDGGPKEDDASSSPGAGTTGDSSAGPPAGPPGGGQFTEKRAKY